MNHSGVSRSAPCARSKGARQLAEYATSDGRVVRLDLQHPILQGSGVVIDPQLGGAEVAVRACALALELLFHRPVDRRLGQGGIEVLDIEDELWPAVAPEVAPHILRTGVAGAVLVRPDCQQLRPVEMWEGAEGHPRHSEARVVTVSLQGERKGLQASGILRRRVGQDELVRVHHCDPSDGGVGMGLAHASRDAHHLHRPMWRLVGKPPRQPRSKGCS
eukprot:scaffold5816_cov267-Pinguiococcus_pyrenoidosus.AAC.13